MTKNKRNSKKWTLILTMQKWIWLGLWISALNILANCKQGNTVGRFISDKDTSFPEDIRSVSAKINKDPNNAELYYLRANAFFFLDKYADAELDFATAIKLDSNNALYNYRIGECILKKDTSNSLLALFHLQKAIQVKPDYTEAKYLLAKLHVARQDYDKAEELLRPMETEPDFIEKSWILRGIIKKEKGDTATAIAMMNKALDNNPNSVDAASQIANMYILQNKPEAELYYKKVLAIDEFDVDAYYHLGLLAQRKGKWNEADKLYNQAISLNRDHVLARYNLAVINLQRGNNDKALDYCTQALDLNPNLVDGLCLKGFLLEMAGDKAQAKQFYSQALKLDPSNEQAKEGLQLLGN